MTMRAPLLQLTSIVFDYQLESVFGLKSRVPGSYECTPRDSNILQVKAFF